nr:ThuA domain-containing protein [Phytoactinopolyspora alkaliphila]
MLVFSKTTGYRHESIEAGAAALSQIGAEAGYGVEVTEDASAFTPQNLAGVAAVVFLSTSGEVFDDAQRRALESYIRSGGGYAGIHAASTTEYHWPFYGDVVGARFNGHPHVQPATVVVEDSTHPATAHLGPTWAWTDEWYNFRADPRGRVNVLLSVDESTYEGGEMGPGHPIAWHHRVDDGRCFYTALGHAPEAFGEPRFRQHLLGGIRHAAGDDPNSGVPSPSAASAP